MSSGFQSCCLLIRWPVAAISSEEGCEAMIDNDRDVELLFEIGSLRHVQRAWTQFGGEDFANVAEHSFRVVWLALLIATSERADTGKVVKMAMVHDLAESRTGDLNYVNKEYVKNLESAAVTDSLSGTCFGSEMQALWVEYKNRSSLEAKIVKDADNIDCDLELSELQSKGSKLPERLKVTRERVFDQLHTETARLLLTKIRRSDCHDWHMKGRNKLNAGDWTKFFGEES